MKRSVAALMMALLCLCAALAAADARPMTKYAPGQRIDIGWGEDVRFIAGCELDDGSTMMLIDTDLADGYLLVDAPAYAFDTITLGMPIPDGSWSASVTAEDLQHCSVVFRKGDETRELHYAYEHTEHGVDEWVLKRYGLRNENGDCFTAELSLFRAELSESKGGKTQTAVVYYDFFRQANNITYPKHPYSIRECRALQEKYPVAAVSPEDPTTRVNLREGPGTDYPRCGSLYAGALFSIYEMEDGWAKIRVGDTDAYISTQFLAFGEEIENVPDMRPTARVRDGEWIEVSRVPYRGGGGSVSRTRGGQEVRIMGEYNSQWRIVSANPGSYYIHADNLR